MKNLIRFIIFSGCLLICVILGFYLKVKIYTFPEPAPFHGDNWYNPYQDLGSNIIKANFHAHTQSWRGLTNGANSEEELLAAYHDKGYNLIGISNYHCIADGFSTNPMYLPLYEHGVNIFKVHNLVLGATKVRMPGFPLHFSLHQTQQMLERSLSAGALNVLAHPGASNLSLDAMSKLSGYRLLEVGNTHGMSTAHWDAALSAGKPIWVVSNDDTHDLELEPTFIRWNIIFSNENTPASAIDALALGQHYGVYSYRTMCENYKLIECTIHHDSLYIRMSEKVNRIDLVGQHGKQMATIAKSNQIAYALKGSDTYIRAEIHMDECVYYLNPMIRCQSLTPEQSSVPTLNTTLTWLLRIAVLLSLILILWLSTRLLKRKRYNKVS